MQLFSHIDKYWRWIIALSISAIVLLMIRIYLGRPGPTPSTPPAPSLIEPQPRPSAPVTVATREYADDDDIASVVEVATRLLAEFHIGPHLIRDRSTSHVVTVPTNFHFIEFYAALRQRLEKVDGVLAAIKEDRAKNRIDLDVLVDDKLAHHFTFLRRSGLKAVTGKAAIIIDDFGYSYNDLVREFLWLNQPLTISIIPGLRESQRVARDAALANRKILIHMPMEPMEGKYIDNHYTLLAGQDPGTIRLRIRSALAEIPAAVGMNNHQGSKVTAQTAIMKTVLDELKRQKKFFIDSRTSHESVAVQIGRSLRVPVAANQLFIDAKDDEDFIRNQMNRLAELAISQGEVIAIAHLRKRTLRLLQELMPQMRVRGVEFVDVTELF